MQGATLFPPSSFPLLPFFFSSPFSFLAYIATLTKEMIFVIFLVQHIHIACRDALMAVVAPVRVYACVCPHEHARVMLWSGCALVR